MGNTGIFQILNSMKDSSNTPLYFYFADLVLQGDLKDENLGAKDKLYLRKDIGEYVQFANRALVLFLKYSDQKAIDSFMEDSDKEENMIEVMKVFGNEEFVDEFSSLIDEFEGSSFLTNLCLSSLTSFINHIELVTENEVLIGIVNQLFKSENSIKVTDLATEADIKGLFKGLLQAVSEVDFDQLNTSLGPDGDTAENAIALQKLEISVVQNLLPSIQQLSLFTDRAAVGNKIIEGLYLYCSENLIDEEIKIEIPKDLDWIEEFNILLSACDPLLTIYYYCIDTDSTLMIEHFVGMFSGKNATILEAAYDTLTDKLTSSKVLDVVFKSSLVGKEIDKMVASITNQENATIPKNIDYVGKQGECAILLESFKILLKNGGGDLILLMLDKKEELSSKDIIGFVEVCTKEIDYANEKTTLLNVILKSKMLYYLLSSYLTYAEFGTFKLYLPAEAVEIIENVPIIKHTEIDTIVDLISNCTDLIVNLIEDFENINYAEILSNAYIQQTAEQSLILQGTLANVIIGVAQEKGMIVLPINYDDPSSWLSAGNRDGETMTLLKAVFALSQVKTDEDSYLINDLLNGAITPKVLLDLDQDTINTICQSKVLRYTISDMITDLGDDGFKIVVAYASLETANALTTTEKKVNVIRASELRDVFIDIKKIILFDTEDNVKINYNAIFKNKEEISQNKTIAATLIQALYDNNDAGFLAIPDNYTEDFEKIKTQENLQGNAWFVQLGNVEDDELYLMLCAVETLIDKDENGDISNDFDFSTLQDQLKLREDSIDVICSSVIMNASISKEVTKRFYVPTDSYGEQVILQKELDSLFSAIFKLFDKTELFLSELNDNLFDLMFKKETINTILASRILVATISQRMSNINDIYIPSAVTINTSYIEREENGFIVDSDELNEIFKAMFLILDTDAIMVNDMAQQLTGLEIHKNSIHNITSSSVLTATVSTKLTAAEQLIILEEDVSQERLVDSTVIDVISREELTKVLDLVFLLLKEDKLVINDLNQQFSHLSLDKNAITSLLTSNILKATISCKITENEELIIPLDITDTKLTNDSFIKNIINDDELYAMIDAMFVLLETDSLELNQINIRLQSFTLTKEKIDKALSSVILQATISNNFIDANSLTIPSIVVDSILTIENEFKSTIIKEELAAFFDALFATTDQVSGKNFELSQMVLPTEESKANTMVNSLIVSATLSNNIMTSGTLLKVIDELKEGYSFQGKISSDLYINQQELSALLLALTNGLGKTDPNNLTIDDIHVPKTDLEKQSLIASEIIRTTISEKVLTQASVYISLYSAHIDTSKHISNQSVGILTGEEILHIIRGIELLNPNEDKNNFDNLVLDVGEILQMENKTEVLIAIADSDVYRSIMSETLNRTIAVGSMSEKAYQLFTTTQSSVVIEGNTYQYAASTLLPNQYVIQFPTASVDVITSFNLETDSLFICERADILALQYASQTINA